MRCDECKKWKRSKESDNYLPDDAIGVCDALPGDLVYIDLVNGWNGGYITWIETNCAFFCAYYEAKYLSV